MKAWENCLNCRYSKFVESNDSSMTKPKFRLRCLRYPPKLVYTGPYKVTGVWPKVSKMDFCGEFQPSPTDTAHTEPPPIPPEYVVDPLS